MTGSMVFPPKSSAVGVKSVSGVPALAKVKAPDVKGVLIEHLILAIGPTEIPVGPVTAKETELVIASKLLATAPLLTPSALIKEAPIGRCTVMSTPVRVSPAASPPF